MSEGEPNPRRGNIMKYGMMACCAVMLVPVAGILLAGGAFGVSGGGLLILAPLALCVGAHFFMHRGTGKTFRENMRPEQDAPARATGSSLQDPAIARE